MRKKSWIVTIILVLIILSIYFIINPSACSNLINGRAVRTHELLPVAEPAGKHNELLPVTGDRPLHTGPQPEPAAPVSQPVSVKPAVSYPANATGSARPAATTSGVTDTNSLQPAAAPDQPTVPATAAAEQPKGPVHTQADIDYAVASRYVELENQYLAQHKDAKNAAKDISYIVMDDFELTPDEWEAFLQRATASNLFEKVRAEQAAKK